MGVLGDLIWLFLRSGCDATSIASALAFHPPSPPSYAFSLGDAVTSPRGIVSNEVVNLTLSEDIAEYFDPTQAEYYAVTTRTGTRVALALFRCSDAKYTLLFSHGNAADLGQMLPLLSKISIVLKVNVVGYDYSGYGASSGLPSEKQTYRDIEVVYAYTCDVLCPGTAIVLYGQSLGSGPSCYLASRQLDEDALEKRRLKQRKLAQKKQQQQQQQQRNPKGVHTERAGEEVTSGGSPAPKNHSSKKSKDDASAGKGYCGGTRQGRGLTFAKRDVDNVCGLILHSPILSGLRVLTETRGILALFDIFPNISRIPQVKCPVFVIHGRDDVEVPFEHGSRIHDAVPNGLQTPPWWVALRGHNDVIMGKEKEYFSRLSQFLAGLPQLHDELLARDSSSEIDENEVENHGGNTGAKVESHAAPIASASASASSTTGSSSASSITSSTSPTPKTATSDTPVVPPPNASSAGPEYPSDPTLAGSVAVASSNVGAAHQ